MNTLEHTVVEILEPAKQIVNEEDCCWEVKAIVECYGHKSTETLRFTRKSAADRVVVGYSFQA